MGGVHHAAAPLAGFGPAHRLAPQCKVAGTVLFILAVVATPRHAVWAHGAYAVLLIVVCLSARVPLGAVLSRLWIELPFLGFALALPFVGRGERVHVVGLSLSRPGLWGAWSILAKGTLGVAATALMLSVTTVPDVLAGLSRLRMPATLVAIASFMVRYIEVIGDELRRMRIARLSRCHDPRWFWQAQAVASTAGALFVRSYERGERVHTAMLSRGYSGTMHVQSARRAPAADWAVVGAVVLSAWSLCALAWITT